MHRRHQGVRIPPTPRTEALTAMHDIMQEFFTYDTKGSKIVMVPQEFYDRVEQCWRMNGIPTLPTLKVMGKRLLAVARTR